MTIIENPESLRVGLDERLHLPTNDSISMNGLSKKIRKKQVSTGACEI